MKRSVRFMLDKVDVYDVPIVPVGVHGDVHDGSRYHVSSNDHDFHTIDEQSLTGKMKIGYSSFNCLVV